MIIIPDGIYGFPEINGNLTPDATIYHSCQGGRHMNKIHPPQICACNKTGKIPYDTAAYCNQSRIACKIIALQDLVYLHCLVYILVLLACLKIMNSHKKTRLG